MGKVASKTEEREALKKIKEIVATLGSSSYIGIAMDGMWELIEENINDDFGNSHKAMIEYRDKEIETLNTKLSNVTEECAELKKHLDREANTVNTLHGTIETLSKKLIDNEQKFEDLCNVENALRRDYEVLKEVTSNKIVHLKAKLYDCMTEKEEKEAK